MEISYVFAHMKLPWFTYHGYFMEYHELRPWYFHEITMVSTLLHSMEYPWYVNHGNFTWAKTYEISIEIPWNF